MTQTYRVHCHSGQTEIQRCGHGFLAVAGSLLATGASSPLCLLAADDTLIAAAPVGDETAAVNTASPVLEIHLPRLQCQKTELPYWVHQAFWPSPIAAATAGNDNGYWVFEWGADCDLSQLYVDNAVITRHSQRAVIATQADSTDRDGYDFRLRYFAPQYGTVEDAVTGSANAVLADYWAGRLGVSRFRALQCSPRGGVVYSRLIANGVAIGGKVERL